MMTKDKHLSSNPLISIVIVTYNAGQTLQQCLDSIYAQTYQPLEIIVIDGKSTDNTVAILEKNTAHIAFWKSENDTGIYDAMNKALQHITGQWVYFLGADDELLPAFSDFARTLDEPNAVYYANVLHNGIKRSGNVSEYYMAKVGIYHQAIIYPGEVFQKYKYNERYKIAADYALNMSLYQDKGFRFIHKDFIIAKYNHTGASATIVDEPFEKDKSSLIRKNFGFKIWLRFWFRQIKSQLRGKKD